MNPSGTDSARSSSARGSDVFIQSRDLRPLDRYFPELHAVLLEKLPDDCVIDGEIVIATPRGLDFEALQLRLHPAASRVAKLAKETPAAFVAFDAIALAGRDLRAVPQAERRVLLEQALADAKPPIHVTPMTRDPAVASEWLSRFEGAGLDGVIAKPEQGTYEPGKRAMIKVKHARTADCVVAGFRWHKAGKNERVGSLLLGSVRRAAGRCTTSASRRRSRWRGGSELVEELAPLRERAHRRASLARVGRGQGGEMTRMPGGQSRWSAGKDLSWEPLRIERVCEVKYDHMQGDGSATRRSFSAGVPTGAPADCRYDQLEVTTPYELEKVFGAASRGR